MSLIGIQTDKTNPPYTAADFTFWQPQFKKYVETEEGKVAFDNLYELANNKVFKSIFGPDWKLAMSLCIAHYLTLIAQQSQAPTGETLGEIAGGGATKGMLASMSVGSFSKSYDLSKTYSDETEAKFWNLTSYGAQYWALLKTKPIASIMVVVPHNIPGAN